MLFSSFYISLVFPVCTADIRDSTIVLYYQCHNLILYYSAMASLHMNEVWGVKTPGSKTAQEVLTARVRDRTARKREGLEENTRAVRKEEEVERECQSKRDRGLQDTIM